jgi:hypothetical protein
MPKALHDKLKRQVEKDHPSWSQEHKDRYIYGTMNRVEEQKKKGKK